MLIREGAIAILALIIAILALITMHTGAYHDTGAYRDTSHHNDTACCMPVGIEHEARKVSALSAVATTVPN